MNSLEVTRVYKTQAGSIKTQPYTISALEVASVRPSNRLGKENHRSTILLTNGVEVEAAEKYSVVTSALFGA